VDREVNDASEIPRLRDRIHILDGILDALGRMGEINHLVSQSKDRNRARDGLLVQPFCYSEVVAQHVLDITVGRGTAAGIEELRRERNQAGERFQELA
jgi:DNA gyrase subunit A